MWSRGTFASARMSGSLSCILPAVSMRTTSKPLSLATHGSQLLALEGSVLRLRTVRDCLFGNTRRVLAISALVQLHTPILLALGKHAQIAHMHAQLLHSARTEGIARRNEDLPGA